MLPLLVFSCSREVAERRQGGRAVPLDPYLAEAEVQRRSRIFHACAILCLERHRRTDHVTRPAKPNREPAPSRKSLNCRRISNVRFSNRELPAVGEEWMFTDHDSQVANHRSLPETVNRVETCVSHRKQTSGQPLPETRRAVRRAVFPLSQIASQTAKGGTVNRPLPHVTHRKQRLRHMKGRNVPVHAKSAKMFVVFASPRQVYFL